MANCRPLSLIYIFTCLLAACASDAQAHGTERARRVVSQLPWSGTALEMAELHYADAEFLRLAEIAHPSRYPATAPLWPLDSGVAERPSLEAMGIDDGVIARIAVMDPHAHRLLEESLLVMDVGKANADALEHQWKRAGRAGLRSESCGGATWRTKRLFDESSAALLEDAMRFPPETRIASPFLLMGAGKSLCPAGELLLGKGQAVQRRQVFAILDAIDAISGTATLSQFRLMLRIPGENRAGDDAPVDLEPGSIRPYAALLLGELATTPEASPEGVLALYSTNCEEARNRNGIMAAQWRKAASQGSDLARLAPRWEVVPLTDACISVARVLDTTQTPTSLSPFFAMSWLFDAWEFAPVN